jgi:hypothetical protein
MPYLNKKCCTRQFEMLQNPPTVMSVILKLFRIAMLWCGVLSALAVQAADSKPVAAQIEPWLVPPVVANRVQPFDLRDVKPLARPLKTSQALNGRIRLISTSPKINSEPDNH